MTAARLPSPYAPLPVLIRQLARAAWGDLGGREWQGVRTTLHALSDSLPDKKAEGTATVPQIAQRAGLSTRWVARCLAALEDLGVIRWQRGGAVEGRPVPSLFRVVKKRLVELIEAARPRQDAADLERRRITNERIKHLRYVVGWHRGGAIERRRRSGQVEVTPSLRPHSGESSGSRRVDGFQNAAPGGARPLGASAAVAPPPSAPSPRRSEATRRREGESLRAWAARVQSLDLGSQTAGEEGRG